MSQRQARNSPAGTGLAGLKRISDDVPLLRLGNEVLQRLRGRQRRRRTPSRPATPKSAAVPGAGMSRTGTA